MGRVISISDVSRLAPLVVQCLHEIYQGHPKQIVLTFLYKMYQANIK